MGWLGNGMTSAQVNNTFTTDYLDKKQVIDKPVPVHPEISVQSRPRFHNVAESREPADSQELLQDPKT